jgi:hypothetical protein
MKRCCRFTYRVVKSLNHSYMKCARCGTVAFIFYKGNYKLGLYSKIKNMIRGVV